MFYILISQLKAALRNNGLHRVIPRTAAAWRAGADNVVAFERSLAKRACGELGASNDDFVRGY